MGKRKDDIDLVDILIVDDRPAELNSLHAILRRADYNIVLARSGQEALAHILRHEFAVILLDVAVPGIDGFEVAGLIREREKSKGVPIIFVTASAYGMNDVFGAYAEGPVDYLRKPVDAARLRSKVAVFVELHRRQKKIEEQAMLLAQMRLREQRLLRQRSNDPFSEGEAAPSSTSVKIMLVDDRRENLLSLQGVLKSGDYELVMANSGEEALKLSLRDDFAVILLDVVMPGIDGFQVASHLKEIERTSRIPIVFLTAVATGMSHIYRAYSVGAVDYLIKPLDVDAVRSKVAVFADLYRQRMEIERQARLLRENEQQEYQTRITEMRLASDKRYSKLVERIDHAIAWTMDPASGQLSFVSRQAERILGYTPAQFCRA